jgi:PAS fold
LRKLKSRGTADTVHPDDLPNVITAWREAVETGRPYDVEGRHRRADRVYRWFRMHGFPLRDMEERIVLWYLVETDIDDRKRAEAVLAGVSLSSASVICDIKKLRSPSLPMPASLRFRTTRQLAKWANNRQVG